MSTGSNYYLHPMNNYILNLIELLTHSFFKQMKNQCSGGDISEPKFLAAHQKKGLYNRVFVDHKHKYLIYKLL